MRIRRSKRDIGRIKGRYEICLSPKTVNARLYALFESIKEKRMLREEK